MISGTAGYIKNTEMRAFYLGQYYFIALDFLNRPQPNGVRDGSDYGYFQDIKIKYNDIGGVTSITRLNSVNFNNVKSEFSEVGSTAVRTWSGFVTTDNKTNGVRLTNPNLITGIDLNISTGIVSSTYTGSGNGFDCSIDAVQLQRSNDNDSTNLMEATGCHKDTASQYEWTPYGENESCSAYIMKEIVANNSLAINTKTAESRTYPILRAVGGIG